MVALDHARRRWPIRFDTHFYLALAPAHAAAGARRRGAVDCAGSRPREALELHAAGEIELVFPTIKHLE